MSNSPIKAMQKHICLYLHMHQPYRLTKLNYLELGQDLDYFQGSKGSENQKVLAKVVKKSYLPTLKVLQKLLKLHPEFRFSLSITGVVLEQLQEYNPEVIDLIAKLVQTGRLEILAETYYHSLASIYSVKEFAEQVLLHNKTIDDLFDFKPVSFRNTELIYNDHIASLVRQLGFQNIIAEGWEGFLGWRNSNYCYTAKTVALTEEEMKLLAKYKISKTIQPELKLLLKNYKLSDDIAFRFSNRQWSEYPLTVDKYIHWLNETSGNLINLFMDFETFGEHQWEDTGIFDFLAKLPAQALKNGIGFKTITEAGKEKSEAEISVTDLTSWADLERDLSAWNGNKMQQACLRYVYDLEEGISSKILVIKSVAQKQQLLDDWRRLQTSDHFYYMSTKYWSDGDVHKYFSPYDSPYEAFINYMNILEDFRQRIDNM